MKNNSIKRMDTFLKIAFSILFFPLSIAQKLISKWEISRFPPSGKIVDIGHHQLHAIRTGKGGPTVILEAGMGGCSLDWVLVQPEISKRATVVSYDRVGYGWSKGNANLATSENYVTDLKMLLDKLNLMPPYILVGHSYGALNMRLFAAKYPEEVSALILIDSVHEQYYLQEFMSDERKIKFRAAVKLNKLGYLFSSLGLLRMVKVQVGTKSLPPNFLKMSKALGYQSSAYKTVYAELLSSEQSAKQVVASNTIPDYISITIISAGRQTEEWKQQQSMLLMLNKNTKQLIAKDSWHSIQLYNPEIVISAINQAIVKIEETISI